MADQWFMVENGSQVGPLNAAQLQEMVRTARLRADSLVWKEGLAQWTSAGEIRGLFQNQPPAPVAPLIPRPSPQPAAFTTFDETDPQLDQMRSLAGKLQILYAILFCGSLTMILLQATVFGSSPASQAIWIVLLASAVGCRLYRTSLVNRHNNIAGGRGRPMI